MLASETPPLPVRVDAGGRPVRTADVARRGTVFDNPANEVVHIYDRGSRAAWRDVVPERGLRRGLETQYLGASYLGVRQNLEDVTGWG